jgi:hypothetical protein
MRSITSKRGRLRCRSQGRAAYSDKGRCKVTRLDHERVVCAPVRTRARRAQQARRAARARSGTGRPRARPSRPARPLPLRPAAARARLPGHRPALPRPAASGPGHQGPMVLAQWQARSSGPLSVCLLCAHGAALQLLLLAWQHTHAQQGVRMVVPRHNPRKTPCSTRAQRGADTGLQCPAAAPRLAAGVGGPRPPRQQRRLQRQQRRGGVRQAPGGAEVLHGLQRCRPERAVHQRISLSDISLCTNRYGGIGHNKGRVA